MNNRKEIEFSSEELSRYSRHLSIPEFGVEGQKKLKAAGVLAVGAGGLGAPLLQYLTAAGVGTIGLIDFDKVEVSNLQRQVLFGTPDVGRSKAKAAKERLQEINPHIRIRVHEERLTSDNALDIIQDYDVIADGTDNFPTRYLVNDACVMLGKPDVFGSIFRFEGQVSVFNYKYNDGNRGPNYRDLFPEPPPPGSVPSCAEAGVLGVLPGIIGSLQANEVIKIITGIATPLAGQLFLFDSRSFAARKVKVTKNRDNPLRGRNSEITGLIDYEAFCGFPAFAVNGEEKQDYDVREVTVEEYKSWLDSNEDIQLVDVRQTYETAIAEIGGELIPLRTIADNADKISRDKKVVVYCRNGQRSAEAVKQLREKHNFDNLYNLKGGIQAWSRKIDESVPEY